MGRISRKGFTLFEAIVSVTVLIIFGLFIGVCGSAIYYLLTSAG
jgi:hypothetical protein